MANYYDRYKADTTQSKILGKYQDDSKFMPLPGSPSPLVTGDFMTVPGEDYSVKGGTFFGNIGDNIQEGMAKEHTKNQEFLDLGGKYDPSLLKGMEDALDPGHGVGVAAAGMIKSGVKLSRIEAIANNKKVDELYTLGMSKLRDKYIDKSLSKIEGFKALNSNELYIAERDKLNEAVYKAFVNDEGDMAKWLGGAKPTPPLYHGTGSDISAFDTSKNIRSTHNIEGIYTTINTTDAGQYAGASFNSSIMPLVGRNENMLNVQDTSLSEEAVKKFKLPKYKLEELKTGKGYNLGGVLRASQLSNKENTDILRSMGVTGLKDGGHYIFFNPTDVKGKFNVGTYSNTDSDLLKAAVPLGSVGAYQVTEDN